MPTIHLLGPASLVAASLVAQMQAWESLEKGMNSRKLLTKLLPRDGNLCGVHIGGCGMRMRNRADASVDHIFTKSFFKDREDSIRPKHYNQEWNCQPMHKECNSSRGGQIYGFPVFTCSCHWLQIDRTSEGHVLTLHYTKNRSKFTFHVTTEGHSFVFRNPSTGKFSDEFGGSSEVEITSVGSMGQLKPGKKGIAGPGHLGHAFPRIDPEEVLLFNRLEIQRVKGTSSETIEKFNRRMLAIWVHYEVV